MSKGHDYDDQVHELAARAPTSTPPSARSPPTTSATPVTSSPPSYESTAGRRRPRLDRGRPASGTRGRQDRRAGDRAVEDRRPPEPAHQDPCHRGRSARDLRGARRGHLRQRHADLLRRALQGRHGRLPGRPRAAAAAGHDLRKIHSVASFFVSRVDTEIDKRLEKIGTAEALELRGKAGVANARLAYAAYEEVFADATFTELGGRGRPRAASAVGVDRREEPGLPRHPLRDRPRRAEHRQHHAREDP